jgi:hypothetical protein
MIDADVKEAMETIAEKYGLVYQPKAGRFDDSTFKVTGEFSTPKTPEADRQEFINAIPYVRGNGGAPVFTENDFEKTFVFRGHTYTVKALHPSRPAYPVSAVRGDGKSFKFPAADVRILLNEGK